MQVGTVIGYDDYWDLACKHASPNIEKYGEARAHAEIAHRHQVAFRCVCGPCGPLPPRAKSAPDALPVVPWGWRTYFVVESIGGGGGRGGASVGPLGPLPATSGMTMSRADAAEFVSHHPTCRGLWDRNSSSWLGIQRRR